MKRSSDETESDNENNKVMKMNGRDDEEVDSEEEVERERGGTVVCGEYVPPAPKAVCSLASEGPRLIITHITNKNFKSYQGTHILGPFHKSFTSIVGPNGSGKSNVIDSVLFVFGYRSTKIRSKKLSVLIHKSEKFQNLTSCTVTVHFASINDSEDGSEIISGSEFTVARTAHSDNSSRYMINGKTSSFKEISSLLMSNGIDLKHNRFLILQGEVEQIALMKPMSLTEHDTGMLEYLEEIIGTGRFKGPIERLNGKFEQLKEEKIEKRQRLVAAEKDRDSLEGPVEEAKEYLKTENFKTSWYNRQYQLFIYKHRKEKLKSEEEKEDISKKMEELENEQKSLQESKLSDDAEYKDHMNEIEEVKKLKTSKQDKFHKSRKKDTQLQTEISELNKKRKLAVESKKFDEVKLKELLKVPEQSAKHKEECAKLMERLTEEESEEKGKLDKLYESCKEATKDLEAERDELQNELLSLKNSTHAKKSSYDIVKLELDTYLSQEKNEKNKLNDYEQSLEKAVNNFSEKTSQIESLRKSIPTMEGELRMLKSKAVELKKEESEVGEKLNKASQNLYEKTEASQSSRSRNKVIDFLMKLKNDGQLPGVFGRLGDLGGIASKYDVAISTACGPLDHVVVDTVKTAKEAVDALKKHNVGRANFIALEKVDWLSKEYSKPLHIPESVPRLFDLISCEDKRLKPAFYFGLRNTLVAKDLEQAKRVSYGKTRFRVVTLEGEIIEVAGTMSGGGRQKLRGRMGRSASVVTSPVDLTKLQLAVDQLEARLANIREEKTRVEDSITSLTAKIKTNKDSLKTFSMQVEEFKKEELDLKKQIKYQKVKLSKCAPDLTHVRELEQKVETCKTEYDKSSKKSEEVEDKLKSVKSQIDALFGSKVKAAKKKVDALNKRIEKLSKEMTKANVAITSSQRESKKLEENIETYATDITESEERLTVLKQEWEEHNVVQRTINNELNELNDKITSLETELTGLKLKKKEIDKKESSIKSKKLGLNEELKAVSKEIQNIDNKIQSNCNKLKDLKLHKIPGRDDVTKVLETYKDSELEEMSADKIKYAISGLEEGLKHMKYDPDVLKAYQEKVKLCEDRKKELEELTVLRDKTYQGLQQLRELRHNEFLASFTKITNKLKEIYQAITFGGDAELELADCLDPFSEGIVFSVRPPRKSWKVISNLSGGEKTLASLALVFALHYYKPSPLYVMDEIDAALDFRNVSIVANFIKERTKNTQFIIISLRPDMFEMAEVLVGIYKTFNCSKSAMILPSVFSQRCSKDSLSN